jgi:hypothetical protein
LSFSHIISFIGSNDNVGVFNNSLEVLIHGLSIYLEFKDTSVNFVNEENWLDLFTEGLSEDGLCVHTDSLDVIYDDQGSISDSQGGSNF